MLNPDIDFDNKVDLPDDSAVDYLEGTNDTSAVCHCETDYHLR